MKIDRVVKVVISEARYRELTDLEKSPDRLPHEVANDMNVGFKNCLDLIMDMKCPTRTGDFVTPPWLDSDLRTIINHMRMGRL